MVKHYCDYCKKEIESSDEMVNLDISAYGCSGYPFREDKDNMNFHVRCALRVRDALDKLLGWDEKAGSHEAQ